MFSHFPIFTRFLKGSEHLALKIVATSRVKEKFLAFFLKKLLSYLRIFFGPSGTISGEFSRKTPPLGGQISRFEGGVFVALDFPVTKNFGSAKTRGGSFY